MSTTPKIKQPPMKIVAEAPVEKHQFWMVYVGGMDQPKMKHPTFAEACKQAQSLCRKCRDRKVYVLESIGVYTPEWVKLRSEARKAALQGGEQKT